MFGARGKKGARNPRRFCTKWTSFAHSKTDMGSAQQKPTIEKAVADYLKFLISTASRMSVPRDKAR